MRLSRAQKRVQTMQLRMADYWFTYKEQENYVDYSDATFIKDALYGIGISIDPDKYEGADGFERFKAVLRDYVAAPTVTGDK